MINGQIPRVIKFGKKDIIKREKNNYVKKVNGKMPSLITSSLGSTEGSHRDYASIAYQWAGDYDSAISFRDYFLKESSCNKLIDIIDNLIQCFFEWYHIKKGHSFPFWDISYR